VNALLRTTFGFDYMGPRNGGKAMDMALVGFGAILVLILRVWFTW
jgi:hypothetical protein